MARKPSAKQEMSSLDVRAAIREMRATLKGARFDKVYEPVPGELLLRFRARDPPRKLDLSVLVGKALHVTTQPRENPEKPSTFVMNLRKHLLNGFVDDVRQHGFDRVVEIVSNRKDGRYLLVIEMFSDGNVVLVKDDRIVSPLTTQSWATREVRAGADWIPPPARADPATLTSEEFRAKMRASNADAVRTLATEVNLGGALAEEVCARAGVAKNRPVAELSDVDLDALHAAVRALMERVETGALEPLVARAGDEKVDVAPFRMAVHEGLDVDTYPTFHEALDAYYGKAVTGERIDPRVRRLDEERAKVKRMLDAQEAAIAKFEKEEGEARRKGDLIYAHFDVASRVSRQLFEASKTLGWKELQERLKEGRAKKLPDAMVVDSVLPNEGVAMLALEDEHGKPVKVKVDLRASVQENADAYYQLSKKQRAKREGALEAVERTRARLKEIEARGVELVDELREKSARKPPTKRFWFEQFRWFLTSDGHLVLAGRDVRSNEKLVSKQLEDQDRYMHAEVSGAPSVVVKAKEGAVSEAALEEAACFAASMSRIWNAGHAAGEAYWVTPQQVSKTPNPGEYVAKGAFIVRGKRNFIRAPIRLAVGECTVEGARKIMGGPVPALAARSARYVVLEPGEVPTNQVANRLSEIFEVNVEEIQTVMPPASVRVVEAHGLEM